MYKKKGQAALEFLMTYGWAILAAIIVIGALGSYFYFSKVTSTIVVVTQPFYGVSAAASASTTDISLEIENKFGQTLTDVDVNVSSGDPTTPCNTTTIGGNIPTVGDIYPSGATVIVLDCPPGTLVEGSSFKGDIRMRYKLQGSVLWQLSTGSVQVPVAA